MSAGIGSARQLSSETSATLWRARNFSSPATEPLTTNSMEERPSLAMASSRRSVSPRCAGRKNSQPVLTIGKPMRRSRCISWNGRPTASRNQSSTTPPTMSKKFTKYTMPAGSQCEKRINRSRANGAATRKRKPSSPRGASLQNAVEPGERQQPGDEHQARRRSGEEGADLGLLGLHHQARIHRLVDLFQVGRTARVKVVAAGQVGDGAQRLLVQAHVHRPAVEADDLAFRRADADGEDTYAALSGETRGEERIGTGGALAIGEEDDDGRAVGARRHRLEVGRRLFLLGAVGVGGDVVAAVGKEHGERDDDRAADGGGALQLEAVDRGVEIFLVGGRRLRHG